MTLREIQLGTLGYEPDPTWPMTPTLAYAGLQPILYFNLFGVIFYTDAVDLAEDILAVKVLSFAPAAWKLLAARANTLAAAASRIPQLVAARGTIDGTRLNSHVSIGGLLASMGVA